MKFDQLREKIETTPVFSLSDVVKWFPDENRATLKVQLHHWKKAHKITSLKRGLYYFTKLALDDVFFIAPKLYFPSYISTESALNYYSIIPDVPHAITSVTNLTTAFFKTSLGSFSFRKIHTRYFFGWRTIKNQANFYNIAEPEKAVIDFLYFHSQELETSDDLKAWRFQFDNSFDWRKLVSTALIFKQPKIHTLALNLRKIYV